MANAENHLIELLPRADRRRLLGHCEPVQLALSQVLSQAGTLTGDAYFPVDGFISVVMPVDGRPSLGVGMVGREGMLGVQLALGMTTSPLLALVQGPGAAWRIGRTAFLRELADSAALRRGLGRYICVFLTQLARATVCVRMHMIGPRLARWLLMSHDRAHMNRFHLTHESVASMLGVRRVGITNAAGTLQRSGLIDYRRGEVQVLDRLGLEAVACSCYAQDRKTYTEALD